MGGGGNICHKFGISFLSDFPEGPELQTDH